MGNSKLVDYTLISPNKTIGRNHSIDTITIHCFVGQVTVERGCKVFKPTSKKASCNYVVAKDGKIGLVVDEKDRSWCTSNSANDNRAVTIEVASDTTGDLKVTDDAYNALIKLVADICKRNNIKKLVWSTDKNKRVNHLDGCNMTVHRDYANKSCPGEYLYSHHGDIASKVNSILNSSNTTSEKTETTVNNNETTKYYRVRKSWSDSKSQIGAYTNLDNAKRVCKTGYSVYDWNGTEVYSNKPNNITATPSSSHYKVKITASALNYRKGPGVSYAINGTITDRGIYTIVEESNGWGKLKSGAGWINLKYTSRV